MVYLAQKKRKTCRLRGCRGKEIYFRYPRAKETLIMLCAMLEKGIVGLPYAQELYNECRRPRRQVPICKRHYDEAATYISNEVARICEIPIEKVFNVEDHVMEEIVTRFEVHRRALDPDFELTINHLARFHRESWNKDAVGLQERKVLFQSDSDDMCFNLEETSAYPYCPESTSNEDTANQVTAQSDPAVDPESILQLDGTDPMLLDKEFLIKGRQLLKLFRFCPSCGSNIFDTAQFVTLTASGTNPIVHYTCTACVPFEKRFEGLEKTCSPPSGMSPDNCEQIAETTITKDSCFFISREQPEEVASYDIKCYPSELLSTKEDCHEQEDHLDFTALDHEMSGNETLEPKIMPKSEFDCSPCVILKETVSELEADVKSLKEEETFEILRFTTAR